MKQNPLTEHCSLCGSPNVSRVEHPISLWEVLAMVPRSLSLLSPVFYPLSLKGNTGKSRQNQQYRCLRCNKTWHI